MLLYLIITAVMAGLRIGRKQLIVDCKMLTSKLGQTLASEGD